MSLPASLLPPECDDQDLLIQISFLEDLACNLRQGAKVCEGNFMMLAIPREEAPVVADRIETVTRALIDRLRAPAPQGDTSCQPPSSPSTPPRPPQPS